MKSHPLRLAQITCDFGSRKPKKWGAIPKSASPFVPQLCCVARAQAGVLLRRLKFALPGWAQAERRRTEWRDQAAQRAAQARAYSGEGHSEEWRFEFSRPYPH